MKPEVFKFEKYSFNSLTGVVVFNYSLGSLKFREKLVFPKEFKSLSGDRAKAFDKALFNLFLIAGISYYKTYCPKTIDLGKYKLSKDQARFWNKVYTKGLGQFFYENKINYKGLINFPYDKNYKEKGYKLKTKNRSLVPLGGGKDSIVVAEKMKEAQMEYELSHMGNSSLVQNVAKVSGKKISYTKREMSSNLFALNKKKGVYNGHIPISVYYSFVLLVRAILYDYKFIVMGNERSANYGNVKYLGNMINHQWSKSIEFEDAFRDYTKKYITPSIEYFSLLRPWHELKIAREFAKYKKYYQIFSSCNVNFKVIKKTTKRWCNVCPKDVFVWTILSPYIAKDELIKIFGKNLYAERGLAQLFWQLLGVKDFKPFECVGLPEEMTLAMIAASKGGEYESDFVMKKFASEILPRIKNVKKYEKLVFSDSAEHNIPAEFLSLLDQKIAILGFAREGLSTYKHLRRINKKQQIAIADKKTLNQFDPEYRKVLKKDKNITFKLGKNYLKDLSEYDLVVKTAGIKLESSAQVTTNLNLFLENVTGKVIGVTGTKGKSTVSSLIYEILKKSGKKVVLVGNIGKPFLDYLKYDSKDTIYVAELSSHQLDTLKGRIDIGVVTSFYPEHLTYHKSLKNYFEAKMNLARSSKIVFYNENHAALKSYIKKMDVKSVAYNKPGIKVETKLLGRANMENIAGAMKVVRYLGVKDSAIIKAIKSFKPLGHRLELVGKYRDVFFYNDVLSTTAESTVAAIDALEGKNLETLIVGGFDRGLDCEGLVRKIKNKSIKNVIYWPHTGEIIAKELKKARTKSRLIRVRNMDETVKAAFKFSTPGAVVLLSPAASSYDYYSDYREKGDEFKKLVRKK